jgi:phage terminase large subunit-like protein
VLRFVKNLPLGTGEWAGQTFPLLPWQERFLRELFGRLAPDKQRQYREAYVEIPRKNGKTTLCAALALYLLLADEEPGAQVYSAAVDRDQASLVFQAAAAMVRADPELEAAVEIIPSQRRMIHRASGSLYRAIPGDAPSAHGYDASAVIYDELHAAPHRELWDVLTTSTGARRQPLVVAITTAGYDRHSICWERHDYATKVRDGVLQDPGFLPVLYAADHADDWTAQATWRKANPSFGHTIKADYLAREAQKAQEIVGYQNTFKRLHLNLWTEQDTRWLDVAAWDACRTDRADLTGRPVFLGLDLSSTTDLTALVLAAPDDTGDGLEVRAQFFCPESGIRRRAQRDRVPYDLWAQQGWITATPGDVVDYDHVRAAAGQWAEAHQVRELAFDRWNATQLITQLQGDGLTCVGFGQGFQGMQAACRELEKRIVARTLRHDGNPVLRWMVANVAVEQDPAGNRKPSKAKSTDRIDGVVALLMALGRAMVHPAGTWSEVTLVSVG